MTKREIQGFLQQQKVHSEQTLVSFFRSKYFDQLSSLSSSLYSSSAKHFMKQNIFLMH